MKLMNKEALGCDISYWQGNVDFVKMRNAGIKVVIIRAGYGTTIDKNFVKYIKGAIAAGIKIGVYWFLYAKNESDAKANAAKFMETIAPYRDHIKLGASADWEYDSDNNAGKLTATARSNIVDVFCKEVQAAGYEVLIYSNQDYIQSGKFTKDLIVKYPLWFAKYSAAPGIYANRGRDGKPYMWQYTSSANGKTYGVSSKNIDLDKIYIDLEDKPVAAAPQPVQSASVPGTLDYSIVFNADFYSGKYPDLKSAFGNNDAKLLEHYLTFGINEGRQAHPDFSVTMYRDLYPDLQAAYGDNLYGYVMHYMVFGRSEGRKGI
ncbi:MAG: hypothetical protein K2K96_14015 [Lachnospiraceae bacterium]|nr:hypothetical protein [Lachnospiraceae bacterium]